MNAQAFPAWVDGRMVAAGEPAIAADDQGFLLGLSVFDTMLFESGCILFEAAHLERLALGAKELGIHFGPDFDPSRALHDYLDRYPGGAPDPLLLRITATRGGSAGRPTMVITARAPENLPPGGVVLALARAPKAAGDPIEQIKSTNRLRNVLALEEARARGAWEALFITTDGLLSEGAISNLFLVLGEGSSQVIATPNLADGCLAGTTRELLIEELRGLGHVVEERPLKLELLGSATEAFLTNTSQRAVGIRQVLDPQGAVFSTRLNPEGPIAKAAFDAVLAREGAFREAQAKKER